MMRVPVEYFPNAAVKHWHHILLGASAVSHRHIGVSARSLAHKEGEMWYTKVLSAWLFLEGTRVSSDELQEVECPGADDGLCAALHP